MWLYLAQGLFMICALDTDVTTNHQRLFISSGPHKKYFKIKNKNKNKIKIKIKK